MLPQPSKFKLEDLAARDDVRVRNPHLGFFANSTVKHWGEFSEMDNTGPIGILSPAVLTDRVVFLDKLEKRQSILKPFFPEPKSRGERIESGALFGAVGLGKDVTFGCDARDAAGFVPVGVTRSHSAGLVGGAESALPRVVAAEFPADDFHEGCGRSRCTR